MFRPDVPNGVVWPVSGAARDVLDRRRGGVCRRGGGLRTRIEPYRVKVVEPIPFTTDAEREQALQDASWNLFRIPTRLITIDMLTDSGFTAMSAHQWASLMEGDEA